MNTNPNLVVIDSVTFERLFSEVHFKDVYDGVTHPYGKRPYYEGAETLEERVRSSVKRREMEGRPVRVPAAKLSCLMQTVRSTDGFIRFFASRVGIFY